MATDKPQAFPRKDQLGRLAVVYSLENLRERYSGFLAPFTGVHNPAIVLQHSTPTAVQAIRFTVNPAAVVGLIISIIINSINLISGVWSFPHILNERHKGIAPTGADHNPPAAIILESLCLRIEASSDHILPCAIHRRGPANCAEAFLRAELGARFRNLSAAANAMRYLGIGNH